MSSGRTFSATWVADRIAGQGGLTHAARAEWTDDFIHTDTRSGGQRHWTPHHTCLANNASCRALSWSALTESTRERRRMKHRPPLPTLRRTPFARGTMTRPANRSRERSLGEVREREQESSADRAARSDRGFAPKAGAYGCENRSRDQNKGPNCLTRSWVTIATRYAMLPKPGPGPRST
jgi:hypothetical protein